MLGQCPEASKRARQLWACIEPDSHTGVTGPSNTITVAILAAVLPPLSARDRYLFTHTRRPEE